jgi:hypothetical protein
LSDELFVHGWFKIAQCKRGMIETPMPQGRT